MSLTAALQSAQASLRTAAAQTAITSRNIAGQSDPSYSRKIAIVTTSTPGSQTVTIGRAADAALFNKMTDATSLAAARQALADGLGELSSTIGDPELDSSPSARVSALGGALQLAAASPGNVSLAADALNSARDVAAALNQATEVVQGLRARADSGIATAVLDLNGALADLHALNSEVVNGTRAGLDVTDKQDARDKVIASIAELVGIHAVTRGGNDVALYTDGGVALFEGAPRTVSMRPTAIFAAGTVGGAVFIDGVRVTGEGSSMPLKSGRIQGLSALRDDAAATYQTQLDEIARGLVSTFSESDLSGGGGPTRPGLFTWSGGPAMPGSALLPGLAGSIRVAAGVDPSAGGNLNLLRDGGISAPGNPAYTANPNGAAGYADRLNQLLAKLGGAQSFDPAASLPPSSTLADFAAASGGWLEGARKAASGDADYQTTLLGRTSEALSNATGVNLDDEMAILLGLEKTYQASAKLMAAVDQMLAGFLAELR